MNKYYSKLSRKQLMKQFDQERQVWLAAGMSESDIYRVHFGEESENGKGGDYRVWLDERKHTRTDHKYSPGTPVAIDAVDPDGAWISGGRSGFDDVEFSIDLKTALATLTELERRYFLESLDGLSNVEIARRDGKDESAIRRTITRAKIKLLKFFS